MTPPRGRAREIARARHAQENGVRLVTLIGPPGVGKTHLARYLAATAERVVHWVDVPDATDDVELVARVRNAMGVTAETDSDDELALLVERFDAVAPLLVLDGCERATAAVRDTIADWLGASTALRLLVTSRERLDVAGEVVVSLAPLDRADAIALFSELVVAIDPDRRLDEALLATIVEHLDRLPLALVLAAPRAARIGLTELARVLDDDARGGIAHASLTRAIARSWSSLEEAERRVLAVSSVFRGGFTLDALRAVLAECAPCRDLATRAAELVCALVDASLVSSRDAAEGARFDLLRVVRAFASDRLDDEGLGEVVRDAHARVFAAQVAQPIDDARSWATSSIERDNLFAAYAHARDRSSPLVEPLVLGLHALLVRQGPAELHQRLLEEGLARATSVATRIDLAIALGRHHALRGAHRRALSVLEPATELARAAQDLPRLAWLDSIACFSLRPLGRLDEARARAVAALDLARELAEPALEGMLEQVVGLVDLAEGNLHAAMQRFRASAALARTCAAPRLQGIALANLADAAHRSGQRDEAELALRESEASFASIGDRLHAMKCAVLAASFLRARGELDRGEDLARRAVEEAREHGDVHAQIELRAELSRLAAARGDMRLARRFVEEGEVLVRRVDDVDLAKMLQGLRDELGRADAIEPTLRVARDGGTLMLGAVTIDLRRRGPLRRILVALATERIDRDARALDVEAVLAAGWPGERMRASSGAARVYMAVRRLRALGLERVLVTDELGYRLDPDVPAAWLENVRRG